MDRIYKTTEDIIMAEEVDNADITVKLLTALDKKEYVLVKRKEEILIYNLSLIGHVTEIADDISFEEYRDIIYAKLDKEALEQGIKPRKKKFWKMLIPREVPSLSKSDKVLMEFHEKFNK